VTHQLGIQSEPLLIEFLLYLSKILKLIFLSARLTHFDSVQAVKTTNRFVKRTEKHFLGNFSLFTLVRNMFFFLCFILILDGVYYNLYISPQAI